MNWVLEHLQILIGAAAAIAYFLNRRRGAAHEEEHEMQRPDGGASAEQAERTRRVQEEIRRKIAERRGAEHVPEHQSPRERIPPFVQPTHVPPVDPFGGPMRRVARKLEEAAARLEERVEDPQEAARKAEMARQARLAEKMRELESERLMEEKRLADLVSKTRTQPIVVRKSPADAEDIHARLRNPHELRRAVILREILGPPVALR
jgi:hypothetical protein